MIYINQDDINERSRQVRVIREVYVAADETICWLGEGSEDSNIAVDIICQLADLMEISGSGSGKELTMGNFYAPHLLGNKHNYDTLQTFYFGRSWFRRVWARQEVAVSDVLTLVCGGKSLDWETFSRVTSELQGNAIIMPSYTMDLESLILIRSYLREYIISKVWFQIDVLLLLCHDCEATLPAKKVYTLLGLTWKADTPELMPNYRLEVHDVYTQLAKTLFEQPDMDPLGPLSVFHFAGFKRERK